MIKKADIFAKTHNTHQGDIFEDRFKKEVDGVIKSKHQQFNTFDHDKEQMAMIVRQYEK